METRLDIAGVLAAITWPLVIAWLVWRFRKVLSELVRAIPARVKTIGFGEFKIELAEARAAVLPAQLVGVDLNRAGRATDLFDTTLQSFEAQVQATEPVDYAVVDLGRGQQWLSSRLYILAVIVRRMRGLKAVVFVEATQRTPRRFVGLCDAGPLRWRLAARFPHLEQAYAQAQAKVWSPGAPDIVVRDDQGRIENTVGPPRAAGDLLKDFLARIQQDNAPIPPVTDWTLLPKNSPAVPDTWEQAIWLDGERVREIVGDALTTSTLFEDELAQADPGNALARIVAGQGDWLAVTDEKAAFRRLLDRRHVVERFARAAAGELARGRGG